MDVEQLDELFVQYGYEIKEKYDSYRVYVLNQGMYHGAEILLFDKFNANTIQERYYRLGYHAKTQRFRTIEDAENYLFAGFFNIKTTSEDIKRKYNAFIKNQIKHYGNTNITYKYISMPYQVYREHSIDKDGNVNIIDSIYNDLNTDGARLIIVEAAAGFGKTCTAYEVYNTFNKDSDRLKPIFTELFQNRDVKQFKYVLWSEIDRERDTTAKQNLVVYNIKKGRIPLIIDGFDELLTKNIDSGNPDQLDDFDQVETMLSTIGDLLKNKAKVILTSRRTAIFAGAEFEQWVDSYNGSFDVVRYQLYKPNAKDWLTKERYALIESRNIPLDSITNPVLLMYLRTVDDTTFNELLKKPEDVTEKYFRFLLERERIRQNIIITYEDQMVIFENLARTFAEFEITGETRSFIKEAINDYNKDELLKYNNFSTTKQTLDELVDTLANHALLDRSENKDFITFINEFVFGYLLGRSILNDNGNFLNRLKRMPYFHIELVISSFKFSSLQDKRSLWNILSELKNRLPIDLSIKADSYLLGEINGNYKLSCIESFEFEKIIFDSIKCSFTNISFVDDTFNGCSFDMKAFENVTFTGCKFINCKIIHSFSNNNVFCYGCEDFSSGFTNEMMDKTDSVQECGENIDVEIKLLNKFFKVDGKTTRKVHLSSLQKDFKETELNSVFSTFDMFKRKGLITVYGNNSYINKAGIAYFQRTKSS